MKLPFFTRNLNPKHILPVANVLRNKPFKSSCTEKYDDWMAKVGIYSETAAGNLKPPPPTLTVIQRIFYLVRRSFRVGGSVRAGVICRFEI